ncbi:MAG: hypothetical protein ACJ8G3_25440 [Burkholderiaceae bacterium]
MPPQEAQREFPGGYWSAPGLTIVSMPAKLTGAALRLFAVARYDAS